MPVHYDDIIWWENIGQKQVTMKNRQVYCEAIRNSLRSVYSSSRASPSSLKIGAALTQMSLYHAVLYISPHSHWMRTSDQTAARNLCKSMIVQAKIAADRALSHCLTVKSQLRYKNDLSTVTYDKLIEFEDGNSDKRVTTNIRL